MKRILTLVLCFCLLLGCSACGSRTVAESVDADWDGVILFTNDAHCGVTEGIGYEGVSLVRESMLSLGKDVLLVDCGDAVQGDIMGSVSKGEYLIGIMNQLGYDVLVPGNHEFDYGMEQFEVLRAQADFPWVSCNFTDTEENAILPPYVMLEAAGAKLAFVGISTPETLSTSTPAFFQDGNGAWKYSFCQDDTGEKLYARVQSAVDAARSEGADYVIALAHLGIEANSSPWMSSDVITHTTGIDVMLDGHSHSVLAEERVLNAEGREVVLASTGTKLASVGCLTMRDGKFTTSLISSADTADYVAGVEEEYRELTESIVAHTDVALCVNDPATGERMVRSNETNIGDLCADALRAYAGADAAILNGGCIRADVPVGDISYAQLITVMPFGNLLCTAEVTGAALLDALELSVSELPGESGGFLQVSGLRFTVDMAVDSTVSLDAESMFAGVAGERRVKDVYVGDEPLDPEKTYILASSEYILKNSGNGYNMFESGNLLSDCIELDNQCLIRYILDTLGGSVGEQYADVYGDGRINIING